MLDALSECVRPTRLRCPTVDLAPFMVDEGVVIGEPPTEAQLEAAQTIDSGCREHGFLHAINFGLTPELEKEAFACARTLFALPESDKAKLSPIDPANGNQGFSTYFSERHNLARPPDLKEAFNTRPPKFTNRFDGCPDDFVAVTQKLWPIIEKATHRYAIALALALGLEEGGYSYFRQTLNELDLCILRFNHYPPCDAPPESGGEASLKSIRIGEHTDFGVYTFLLLGEGAKGLQVKPVTGGEVGGGRGGELDGWLDVETATPPPGSVGVRDRASNLRPLS